MAAHSRRCVKLHALHFAGSIVFNDPKNTWKTLQPILSLLSTPYISGRENQSSGVLLNISLCFSTLIICIWSTVHFNIPVKRYTVTRCCFTQMSWMFIALLTPRTRGPALPRNK